MSYSHVSTGKLLDLGAALLRIKDSSEPKTTDILGNICDELSAIDVELESRQPVIEWPLIEVVYLDRAGVGVEVEHELLEGVEDKLWASI